MSAAIDLQRAFWRACDAAIEASGRAAATCLLGSFFCALAGVGLGIDGLTGWASAVFSGPAKTSVLSGDCAHAVSEYVTLPLDSHRKMRPATDSGSASVKRHTAKPQTAIKALDILAMATPSVLGILARE